jgi:hypothetical protein
MRRILPILSVACLSLIARARGESSYPMVMSIQPVAVQVGRVSTCEVSARYNLYGTYKVFVTGAGVTGEVDPPAKPKDAKIPQVGKLKVRFKVAPDALPGVRDVRLATPSGVSTLGQIVIVRDPVIVEAPNNDTLATAQPITLPATVCGTLEKAEDVDFYKFSIAAGSAWTFHVRAQRLENRIHDLQEHVDPILTLRNAAGTILAANDNFYAGDPLLFYHFQAAGTYYLEIRDTRYAGNADWKYCIEINDRPFVTGVFPSRVTPGSTAHFQVAGFNLRPGAVASAPVPSSMADGPGWLPITVDGQPANPAPVIVSRLPEVIETAGDNNTAAHAQPIAVPAGVSGRIETPGDVDCYAFQAKAGERFSFEIVAHDHESPLDSLLRILNDKGDRIAENDDYSDRWVHADSRLENWTAPANGRYVIEVSDVHRRGGPSFVYFLKVTHAEPFFTLETDTDKTLLTPGANAVIYARANRKNGFAGEIQLAVDGLPATVTAWCGRILAGGTDGCIILHAADTAPLEAGNLQITGHSSYKDSTGKTRELNAVARPLQEVYMPGGGRFHYPVEMHTLSVGKPSDIQSVHLQPTSVSLKPGESKRIDITLKRSAGFKGNVTIEAFYQHLGTVFGDSLPPGVTVDDKVGQTLLTGEQSAGYITLKAAADAKPVKDQQVAVMAHVSINFVMKYTYCAEPLLVTVLPAK